jgi:hypothetical protein
MPNPYFIGFELLEAVIFALCLRHAYRAGYGTLWRLLAGVLFGLSLELLTIHQIGAYHYGRFSVMVLEVPLAVGVAWGNQLYGARLFSDATSIPIWLRPIAEAVLVIYIDLLVEPVATQLGMWQFGLPLESEWFGTPYGNFWGFFWLVVLFGISFRLLERLPHLSWRLAVSPLVLLLGLVASQILNAIAYYLLSHQQRNWATASVLFLGVVAVWMSRPKLLHQPPGAAWLFIALSLAYFFGIGLLSGVLLQPTRLLVMSALVTVLGFAACLRWATHARPQPYESGSS